MLPTALQEEQVLIEGLLVMKYMGSKARIVRQILPIMLNEAKARKLDTWIEPFVGGGNVIQHVPHTLNRFGSDVNPHAIEALRAIRDMPGSLPDVVTEEAYKIAKNSSPCPISSWVRFVCSFAGKFDAGYARSKGRNHAAEAKRNAIRQNQLLSGVTLTCDSYEHAYKWGGPALYYCDPPYKGTTGYSSNLPKFDHDQFFEWCRMMKKLGHSVFISEYEAPDDFECVWQGKVKTNFSSTREVTTRTAVEKLFKA